MRIGKNKSAAFWSAVRPRCVISFTAVGYANGVAAGTHVLTTTYSHTSNLGDSFQCYRDCEPYLIEVEEVP